MKVLLISIDPYLTTAIGVRTISNYIKKNGISVKCLFLALSDEITYKDKFKPIIKKIQPHLIAQMADFINKEGFSVVGMSFMTVGYGIAKQLTGDLKKKINIPIVWGGIHPTVCPDECLKTVSAICLGEGEEAFLEYIDNVKQGKYFLHSKNMWFKNGDEIIRNPVSLNSSSLDKIATQDYDYSDHYLFHEGQLVGMDESLLYNYMPHWMGRESICYLVEGSRGCSFKCTYCFNSKSRFLYDNKFRVRTRSVDTIIDDLKNIKTRLEKITHVFFQDEVFLAQRNADEVTYFCEQYKKYIALPFSIVTHAYGVTDEIICKLANAGLFTIQVGLQSASKETCSKVYNRVSDENKYLNAAKIFKRYSDTVVPIYDIILDNPYEKDSDLIATLNFLQKLPHPREIRLYSLTLFPGTLLYDRFKSEHGLSDKEMAKKFYSNNYNKINYWKYINNIFLLLHILNNTQVDWLIKMRRNLIFKPFIMMLFLLLHKRIYIAENRVYQFLKFRIKKIMKLQILLPEMSRYEKV